MSITKCVLVEAVQRYDAAEGSYMMQSRRPKHRWCPGAELNHRHTDFQSVALPTELPGRLARGAYRGNFAFLSSRALPPLASSNSFIVLPEVAALIASAQIEVGQQPFFS